MEKLNCSEKGITVVIFYTQPHTFSGWTFIISSSTYPHNRCTHQKDVTHMIADTFTHIPTQEVTHTIADTFTHIPPQLLCMYGKGYTLLIFNGEMKVS